MPDTETLRLFEDQPICTALDRETVERFFSIADAAR